MIADVVCGGCSSLIAARLGRGSQFGLPLSATIRPGLTEWGAGPSAPFHGFIIDLHSRLPASSCIDFEIHITSILHPARHAVPPIEENE